MIVEDDDVYKTVGDFKDFSTITENDDELYVFIQSWDSFRILPPLYSVIMILITVTVRF